MDSGFSGLGGVLLAVLATALAVLIVSGSLILSFSESGIPISLLPAPSTSPEASLPPGSADPTASSTAVFSPLSATVSPTLLPTHTLLPTITPTGPSTGTPTSTACPPPPGWKPITISQGDTLNDLSQEYGTTPDELIEANCLEKSQLEPGSTLYVPAKSEPSAVPCGPPPGWVYTYVVQPGDTLFSISLRAGVSVGQLKEANCLKSDNIRVGQKLAVPVPISPPPAPTRTPVRIQPSPTSPPPTPTPLPPTATEAPRRTPEPPAPTLEVPTPTGTG